MTKVSTTSRRITGGARLLVAATLLAALIYQIVDKIANNDLEPSTYYTLFTIESTMIAIVVVAIGGLLALRHPFDTLGYTSVRLAVTSYAIMTAVVYNLLLRGLPPEGYVGPQWPGEIMHVWFPIYIALDWLFAPGRPAIGWRALWVVVIYPFLWLGFTLIRGSVDGWYPYPFLDPASGWGSVLVYIGVITGFVIGVAALLIAYSRWRGRRSA
jgi:hypothetical protein